MSCILAIAPDTDSVNVLGTRHSAIAFRERITRQLESCQTVQLDFVGIFVTQSFVDELFGPLILRMGPGLLDRLAFSGCGEDTRAILNLVFASRLQDFSSRQQEHPTSQADRAADEAFK
ncbi:MAG: STAS-like domain-containing protein [Gammaproteobacteria bacterium]